jgi:hypothetical protein
MDFISSILVQKYAGKHDPNRHVRNMQTPIDITDLANLCLELDGEITRLQGLLDEARSQSQYAETHGVQDDGSSKFVP